MISSKQLQRWYDKGYADGYSGATVTRPWFEDYGIREKATNALYFYGYKEGKTARPGSLTLEEVVEGAKLYGKVLVDSGP